MGGWSILSGSSERAVFDIAGVGASLYFFSRMQGNWFLEFSLGAAARIQGEENNFAGSNVEVSAIIPFLFGARYDLLPSRFDSSLPLALISVYKDDRVQFASETLDLRHGDRDDLVVLYASFLERPGIQTAFVEVNDPEKDLAHLYLMFNSGLTADQGHLISSNEKRYVIREDARGRRVIWIPVETTLVASGLEEAWQAGALEYLKMASCVKVWLRSG